jgi:hypothetical protein
VHLANIPSRTLAILSFDNHARDGFEADQVAANQFSGTRRAVKSAIMS